MVAWDKPPDQIKGKSDTNHLERWVQIDDMGSNVMPVFSPLELSAILVIAWLVIPETEATDYHILNV